MTDHYEKAKQAWETAGKLVQGDRRETHGDFKTNFQAIADLWSVYIANVATKRKAMEPLIQAEDVAQMMVLLKVARAMNGGINIDDYIDAIGYSMIAAGLVHSEELPKQRR